RFPKRMPPNVIRQLVALHDHLRTKLFPLPKPRTTLTFDLDSVVLTVYGKLQYARVGYNRHKRRRRSYHPLISYEAHLQALRDGRSARLVTFPCTCNTRLASSSCAVRSLKTRWKINKCPTSRIASMPSIFWSQT